MIRTQVELPDELHAEVRRVARERGISMSEVIRRGLQHMTEQVYPPLPRRLARKTAALGSAPRHRR
jgi:Arc/MetJ-type ribon-helix-helix transcriptional regulator